MIPYLHRIMEGHSLLEAEMSEVMDRMMEGQYTSTQIAGLLIALRMKGESVEEIAGAAASMRRHAVRVDTGGLPVVDTCGTGGDGLGTFNISTLAALVVAGAGVRVAKHGNRAVTSRCGSADLLAALGVNIESPPEIVEECIRECGIGFLFAPKLHPAMRYVMGPRRELGVRTIFNLLGPLTNPAGARCQLLGVFAPELTETLAHVLRRLGSRRAILVHGHDGMDEITTTSGTRVTELCDGQIRTYDFDPLPFIGSYASPNDLAGGDAAANVAIAQEVLSGKRYPARDIVCLNAAAAIVVGGIAKDFRSGWEAAQHSLDSGRARQVLEKLVEVSNRT